MQHNNYSQGSYPPSSYGQQGTMKSQHSTVNSLGGSTMLSRRTVSRPPPRIRPIMILFFVLTIGVFIIGLILTIIAYWPGYSSVGGNPLKIVGPCILGASFLALCILIVNSIWYGVKETKHNQQREALVIAQAHARSQMSLDQRSQVSTPTKRPKSILKNPSNSTSTFNGELRNSQSDTSYRSDDLSNASTGSMNPDQVQISMDPSGRPAYSNRGYTPDTSVVGQRSVQTYPNQGYDMYDQSMSGQGSLAGQPDIIGRSDMMGMTPPRPTQQTIPRSAQMPPRREQEAMVASPASYSQPRWGQNRNSAESGYAPEYDHNVSNVSQTYGQMTTPHRPPGHYTPQTTASPANPSAASTEV